MYWATVLLAGYWALHTLCQLPSTTGQEGEATKGRVLSQAGARTGKGSEAVKEPILWQGKGMGGQQKREWLPQTRRFRSGCGQLHLGALESRWQTEM